MILFSRASDISNYLKIKSENGNSIGFVPTMGALHSGHLSLLEASKKVQSLSVVSIFVNPTQFNEKADFERYPVSIEKDIELLEQAGCDVLFLPSVTEMYPNGTHNLPHYALGNLEDILEGYYRPGHFQGVCQVMHRLLDIIEPDTLIMGRKDYQQCLVIQNLLTQFGWKTSLTIAPTLREISGLAMSSRNRLLGEAELEKATAIYQTLQFLKNNLQPGKTDMLLAESISFLQETGFNKIDYVSIADAKTLAPVTLWDGKGKTVALVAAFINGIRLIDNLPLQE